MTLAQSRPRCAGSLAGAAARPRLQARHRRGVPLRHHRWAAGARLVRQHGCMEGACIVDGSKPAGKSARLAPKPRACPPAPVQRTTRAAAAPARPPTPARSHATAARWPRGSTAPTSLTPCLATGGGACPPACPPARLLRCLPNSRKQGRLAWAGQQVATAGARASRAAICRRLHAMC